MSGRKTRGLFLRIKCPSGPRKGQSELNVELVDIGGGKVLRGSGPSRITWTGLAKENMKDVATPVGIVYRPYSR